MICQGWCCCTWSSGCSVQHGWTQHKHFQQLLFLVAFIMRAGHGEGCMATFCWLLEHLLIAHPLNQLVLDLIKQQPSRGWGDRGAPGYALKSRVHISRSGGCASIPAWQWWVSGVSEPLVHRSIVSARYSTARLSANPGLFQENVLVAPIFTDCEGCCGDLSFALWVWQAFLWTDPLAERPEQNRLC